MLSEFRWDHDEGWNMKSIENVLIKFKLKATGINSKRGDLTEFTKTGEEMKIY